MSRTWKQGLVALPGVGVSLLPKLACPLCWPAYAGLLSSVGLGFLISTKYLLPLTIAFLGIALAALAFRAKNRHGYGPFVLGLIAAIGVLVGKFVWGSNSALYGSVALLVVASLWNAWPHRVTSAQCCTEKQCIKGVLNIMSVRKKIEVFSAGCSTCKETIETVKRLAGSHKVVVHDMNKSEVASKAKEYGVRTVPAVVIDGKLASCCANRGPDEHVLRSALA